MPKQRSKRRYTATPSHLEVNLRAIRPLKPDGWRLYNLDEFPIVGTVPKNYLSYGNPHKSGTLGYIAKKGRTTNDARECVTEEIISKIGALLPLNMATSKLARLSKTDVRFLSQNFVIRGRHELLHGIELVARYFETNPTDVESAFDLKDRKAEQGLYTIGNMLTVLESLFPQYFSSLRADFFKMLAFDAFVGAPDRHAMNWGVLAPLTKNSEPVRFAPIFDTARGLFREYSDADLQQQERQHGRWRFLERYAERSRPILSIEEAPRQNHFKLIKWIASNFPDKDCEHMCSVFNSVNLCAIEHMLQRSFRRIITQFRIVLVTNLLEVRMRRIREEIGR